MDGQAATLAPPDAPPDAAPRTVAELERENAKLRKINSVLMGRVERSMDFQGNAFSLFQTAIMLEGRVMDRTLELEAALRELGKSNRALSIAKDEAETAQMRLAAAIEGVSEGFILCDSEDRLVMCNSKYRELWPGLAELIQPGVPFEALLQHAHSLGLFDDGDTPLGTSRARRMQHHHEPQEMFVLKLADGRWLQISERRTADGGSVAIHTDITEIKLSEQRQRERELAEKNVLLQATFDNISQGVSVVDHERRLVAWNERFLELVAIAPDELAPGKPLRDLIHLPAIRCQLVHSSFGAAPADLHTFSVEQVGENGRVLEIQFGPMPGGGMVSTYTDITERKASEWALRDSEQRIRLITDALPALIAYVDSSQRYRFTNKSYEEWFARPRSEINGRHMRTVLGPELYDARRDYVEMVLAGQRVTFEMNLPLIRGRVEFALATYVPHFGAEGEVLGFIALIQDITTRKKAAEELREAKEGLERRVAERTAELTMLNCKLSHEVDDRRVAEEAARVAKAEAEQANMSKTKFIAAASHDLLQPLNAARVFAAALSESRMAERNRALAVRVNTALNSVDELLTTLLDISKLDAGGHPPDIADFTIDGLLGPLAAEYAPQAKARDLGLRRVACGAVVRSDALMVGRILRNFISNAMRYTPSGAILIGCRRRADGLEVQVWDKGIGIAADKLTEIFEEFRRLAVDSCGRDRGMGLGLAIVERIARCLGHDVRVRSWPGRGSVFSVVLPFGAAQRVRPQDVHPNLPAPIDRVAGSVVVVVENDAEVLEGMCALLHAWHCTVVAASSAAAAVAQLRAVGRRPSAVIVDYHLDSGQTGLQALALIQDLYEPPLPGIVVTADRTDEMQNAVRLGGYHLLNKPLKPARLRSLLAHLTGPGAG